MNRPPFSPRQREQLLQDLEDGCISADDHRLLMERMRNDRRLRDQYLEHMALISALHAQATSVAGIEGRVPGRLTPLEETSRRRFAGALMFAAAAVVVFAGVLAIIGAPKPKPGEIRAAEGAAWRIHAGGPDGQNGFREGTRVVVDRGVVEMATQQGTRVVLEGPADFTWKGPLQGELRAGQAWFEIAPQDIGYVVRTQRLRLTDLGTAFGVRLTGGMDEVHVSDGLVRVESLLPNITPRELRAGEAAIADAVGRTREIAFDGRGFQQTLPAHPPFVRWSFEGKSGEILSATGTDAAKAELSLADQSPDVVPGVFGGQALNLETADRGAFSRFPGILGGGPRTIALWVKGRPVPSRFNEDLIEIHPTLVYWGRGDNGHKWHLVLSADGTALVVQWGGSWLNTPLSDGATALDGQWHHLASVFTGRIGDGGVPEIIHYHNGQRLATGDVRQLAPILTLPNTHPENGLAIGYPNEWSRIPNRVSPWHFDEVVIVRHPLDARQIRELHQTNSWSWESAAE